MFARNLYKEKHNARRSDRSTNAAGESSSQPRDSDTASSIITAIEQTQEEV